MHHPRHPARIAHLGVGAFARSHQAWYTQAANDSQPRDAWGIVALPSRTTTTLDALAAQDYRYGMIVRGADADTVSEIGSFVAVSKSASDAIGEPELSVVTMTVTEAGYEPGALPASILADGFHARMVRGGGPITVIPCDNVPSNGAVLERAVHAVVDGELASWIADNVSFVSTMVDRITPAATQSDREIASAALGWHDAIPVVTEPFTEWVLQGEFPAGRPDWELGGARFVANVEPYEQRKLWMLNAAHSLLAYRGLELGLATVHEGWHSLAAEVEQLWDEARVVLPIDAEELDAWLAELRQRWENSRIEHRLAQIADGGEQKIPSRIGAVIRAREIAGLPPGTAELETIAAWDRYRETARYREVQP